MKNVLLISLLFINTIFAQNKTIKGIIEYEQIITNNQDVIVQRYDLFFDRGNSYYEEVIESELKKSQQKKEDGTILLSIRDNKKSQFYFNNLQKGFYFREIYYNKPLIVKEENNQISWKLSNETKLLGGVECLKATAQFRGREYTAWFTKDIPVPFGPWKLNGLSGLIIEAYDSSGFFKVRATKISIGDSEKVNLKIKKINLKNVLTMTEFFVKKRELETDFITQLNSRLPKGIKPFKIDKNCNDCGKELEIFNKKN